MQRNSRRAHLLAGVAATVLIACGGGDASSSDGNPVAFTTVALSSFSAIGTAGVAVVSEPQIWRELWGRHVANMVPPPAVPAVDFAREQVLAYFAGSQPSGCDGATIVGVADQAVLRVVRVQISRSTGTGACPAVVATPAHFVRVPAAPLRVEFRVE